MHNQIQTFDFQGNVTRVAEINGAHWFIAKDICQILGLSDVSMALSRLDTDEKLIQKLFVSGQNRDIALINESGLYALIMRSYKPSAKQFRKWVTAEVLPAIRKHGVYMSPEKIEEVLINPDTIIKLAHALKDEQTRRQALEAQAEADRPKLLFADAVSGSPSSISVGALAKLITQSNGAYEIGQKRLFEWLRKHGFLMKRGMDKNMPTQRYVEAGLFEVKERVISNSGGWDSFITRTTMITGKGQQYFINLFCGMAEGEEAALA